VVEDNMNWDEYFFNIAEAVSIKSHCLSHRVGAIAVRNNKFIVSTGYNGPAMGYPHCEGPGCPRRRAGYSSGQGLEICPAAHAERNVIAEAARLGIPLEGCALYLTSLYPCRECAKEIVNAGIVEVVIRPGEYYPDIGITGKKILETCGVKVRTVQ
jgi:dCMP deaminase